MSTLSQWNTPREPPDPKQAARAEASVEKYNEGKHFNVNGCRYVCRLTAELIRPGSGWFSVVFRQKEDGLGSRSSRGLSSAAVVIIIVMTIEIFDRNGRVDRRRLGIFLAVVDDEDRWIVLCFRLCRR